ncbi:MAG: glycine--tRNA ligase subunit beta [Alphaproteobacteria bacterium]|jgi:glycyl-tRNA synthetase beta chain|nr:glycine--tRNA ligase subunit beta [Alphaproteobacteria bacterium]
MAEFFLEIFSEEIPARMQLRASDDLKKILEDELKARGLTFSGIETFVTPRRLVGVVRDLIEATKGTIEDRRGPKVGAPEGAIQGFLKAAGTTLEACEQRDGYYYARIETQSQQTQDVLPEIVQAVFSKIVWPKSMFWALEGGAKSQFWVRAVRSVITLFGGKVLSFELPTMGLVTGNTTQGHRFLKPDVFEVSSFADYQAKLEKAFVILDHQVRQTLIWEGLEASAHQKGLHVQPDQGLLQEVAGLVEYPVPLLGKIESQFMSLPPAVLSTSMRVHQKYFTVMDKDGKIAPYFGVIANTKGADGGTKMIAGYERVLRARLSDAAFFFDHDVKIPLEEFSRRLNTIVFQAKLGTLDQKCARLKILMTAQGAPDAETRAATLAKADLLTSMVGEFPELQGVMGEIYATAQGEFPDVAAAIREHYQPQGPNDSCPSAPLSIALGLADKLDSLIGFFGIGEEPTGSKDPFALRRAALGIIRLIRENDLEKLQLEPLCDAAVLGYTNQGISLKADLTKTVLDFIIDRLKVALRAEGIRHDYVTAVTEGSREDYSHDNIWVITNRAKALQDLVETKDGQALLAGFRRANGILQEEQKRDSIQYTGGQYNDTLPSQPQELNLYKRLEKIHITRAEALKTHDYVKLMRELAALRPEVDAFFELKINDEDPKVRQNRLQLLGKFVTETSLVADFSKIEG